MRWSWWWVVMGVLGTGCHRPASSEAEVADRAEVATRVTTVPVRWSETGRPVEMVGETVRRREVALAFKVPGWIASLEVRPGDAVTAGQVLARLTGQETGAELDRAVAALDLAERDRVRLERLVADGAATTRELDVARTARDQAQAAVRAARFNADRVEIRAPSDGVILSRLSEPGAFVEPGTPVVRFADQQAGWLIRGQVAPSAAVRVAAGNTLAWETHDGRAGEGRVERVGAGVDPASGLVLVEATPVGPVVPRLSGETVRVRILPSNGVRHAVVPAVALVEGSGRKATVFVVEGDRARAVPVAVDDFRDGEAHLMTGLPEDARVVVLGGAYLSDGDRIGFRSSAPAVGDSP